MTNDKQIMIQMKNIHKSYGDVHVLEGVDLTVYRGEVVAVIGPSGSGKSTLLRCINKLENINKGTIEIEGIVIESKDMPDKLASNAEIKIGLGKTGMVFQSFNLFPHMTVLRNIVEAPVRVLGIARGEAEARAIELLKMVGLADKKDHYPVQLSGGQQQRVAIARSLAGSPRLLLADEPTGNLDPANSHAVFEALRELAKTTGVAALIATHNMELAGHMDRVFALKDGHLEQRAAQSQAY